MASAYLAVATGLKARRAARDDAPLSCVCDRRTAQVVDPELPDEFALEDRNDREISVRHQASGHVYLFRISGAELVSGSTTVPNPDSDVDAVSLRTCSQKRSSRTHRGGVETRSGG